MKSLQRDINLAAKATSMMKELIELQEYLLDPAADPGGKTTQATQTCVLEFYDALRDHDRKINVVEKKGQRA